MGGKRKTEEDYYKLAQQRDFKWHGPFPGRVDMKSLWECDKGHKWETTHHGIARGNGCPYCIGKAKKIPADYHALAEERGFTWTGSMPHNTLAKTWWECQEGHGWQTAYRNIQSGRGCPDCYRKRKLKTPDDYHALAEEREFSWLGPLPKTTHYKTQWQCSKFHKWAAPYSSLQQGIGCPYCAGKARKVPADYHAIAKENGIEWVGLFPNTVLDKTLWRCQSGHEWRSHYNSIWQGKGCLRCYEETSRLISDDYIILAAKLGIKWLGPLPPNNKTKTAWGCSKGHQWQRRYSDMKYGNGCPECADIVNGRRVSNVQRQLCEIMRGKLNYPFGNYNIDVAFPDEMVAVEYDSWYWHGHKQDLDKSRDNDLIANGWKILHVKSNGKLPTTQQLDVALIQLMDGQEIAEIILDDWGQGPTFMELRSE